MMEVLVIFRYFAAAWLFLFIGQAESARRCYSSNRGTYSSCSSRQSCCSSNYDPCCSDSSLSTGYIAGIVIGCIFVICVVAFFVFMKHRMNKRKKQVTQVGTVQTIQTTHQYPGPVAGSSTSYGYGASNPGNQTYPPIPSVQNQYGSDPVYPPPPPPMY